MTPKIIKLPPTDLKKFILTPNYPSSNKSTSNPPRKRHFDLEWPKKSLFLKLCSGCALCDQRNNAGWQSELSSPNRASGPSRLYGSRNFTRGETERKGLVSFQLQDERKWMFQHKWCKTGRLHDLVQWNGAAWRSWRSSKRLKDWFNRCWEGSS